MTASLQGIKKSHGIAISSLIRAFHCTRQYYFQKDSEWNPSGRYIICKQVSISDQGTSENDIWDTIRLVYLDISPEDRTFLSSSLILTKNAPLRSWTEIDITVRFDKLSLYGLLDKYDAGTGECTVTRCTKAPKTGCWAEDRIRTAALLLCISETIQNTPSGVYIEYIPSGIIRYYEPTPRDKRQVIQIIRQIQDMNAGKFPAKPMKSPCHGCQFEKRCSDYEPQRLSDLFKKGQ